MFTLALLVLAGCSGCAEAQTVAPTPPPGTPPPPTTPPSQPSEGLVFESNWSSGTGNTQHAVTDGGRWPGLACINTFPTVLTVVAGAPVGFSERPSVLRVQFRGEMGCGMLQKNDAVPISTTHWGRFYFRNDDQGSKNDHPVAYHNIHGADDIQAVPFTRHANNTNGATTGQWVTSAVVNGVKWWSPPLRNGLWYRFEWEMRYLTPLTYRFFPRIYDASGNLVYDADDYSYPGSGGSLLSYYSQGNVGTLANGGTANAELARNFGLGNEGPGGQPNTGGYYYYGAFALSTSGWIGR